MLNYSEKILLFLTVFLLPTQLGRHFWPTFSYIYSLPVDYLSPVIYFWDLLVALLISVFILQKKKLNLSALNLLLFFILTQALSLLPKLSQPASVGVGLVRLEQYLIAGLFGLYISSINLKVVKKIFFYGVTTALVLESLIAIGQFFKGATLGLWLLGERTFTISTPAIAKFDFQGSQFLRPYATLPHPNVLAAFLIVYTLLLFSLYQGFSKRGFYISLILSAVTILITVSRGAILVGVILLFLNLRQKKLIYLLLGLAVLSPFLYTRFFSLFNYDNISLLRREGLLEQGLSAFLSAPVFGIGLNNFIPFVSSQLIAGPSRFLQPIHNIFVLALAETGLVGFLGWVVLMGYPIYKNVKFTIYNVQLKQIWLVILFLGLFDHYFLTLAQGYRLLFLIWGISLAQLRPLFFRDKIN